jgi:hypothetical protein
MFSIDVIFSICAWFNPWMQNPYYEGLPECISGPYFTTGLYLKESCI